MVSYKQNLGGRIVVSISRLTKNKKILVGLLILAPIISAAILGSTLAPMSPTETNPEKYAPPGGEYALGTDNLGRDLLSRVIIGSQATLLLGVVSTGMALAFAIPIGLVAGYYGGRVDEFLMRAMDIFMSVPTLLLGLLLLTVLNSNIWNAILAVGIVFTPKIARVIRSSTLSIKNEEFINAAVARNESDLYVLFREILPNIFPVIAVEGSVRVGYAIVIGSSLSFLGLGVQPPRPDWGFMVAQARDHIWLTPWYLLWPAIGLGLAILGFNLLGDGLREVLDPRITGDRL